MSEMRTLVLPPFTPDFDVESFLCSGGCKSFTFHFHHWLVVLLCFWGDLFNGLFASRILCLRTLLASTLLCSLPSSAFGLILLLVLCFSESDFLVASDKTVDLWLLA